METKICPNCKKSYVPVLGCRKQPEKLIQDEFPDSAPWEREQLITGICSNRCWNAYLGANLGPRRDGK